MSFASDCPWSAYIAGAHVKTDHVRLDGMAMRNEMDQALRLRLLYVAGDTPAERSRIEMAREQELDDLAWRYGLKRRQYPA